MAFSLLLIGLTSYDTRCLMSKLRNVRRTISTEWTGLYPSVNAVTHQRCWPCVQVRGPKHTRAGNLDLCTCLPADAALALDVYGNGHCPPSRVVWYCAGATVSGPQYRKKPKLKRVLRNVGSRGLRDDTAAETTAPDRSFDEARVPASLPRGRPGIWSRRCRRTSCRRCRPSSSGWTSGASCGSSSFCNSGMSAIARKHDDSTD